MLQVTQEVHWVTKLLFRNVILGQHLQERAGRAWQGLQGSLQPLLLPPLGRDGAVRAGTKGTRRGWLRGLAGPAGPRDDVSVRPGGAGRLGVDGDRAVPVCLKGHAQPCWEQGFIWELTAKRRMQVSSVTAVHQLHSGKISIRTFKTFSKVCGMARTTSHMPRAVLQAQNTLSVGLPQPQGRGLGQPRRTQAVLRPL